MDPRGIGARPSDGEPVGEPHGPQGGQRKSDGYVPPGRRSPQRPAYEQPPLNQAPRKSKMLCTVGAGPLPSLPTRAYGLPLNQPARKSKMSWTLITPFLL